MFGTGLFAPIFQRLAARWPSARRMPVGHRYEFGRNWQHYLQTLTEERITIAQQRLLGFLGLPDLEGHDFIDIGCGSGIHSLAAFRAGARRIVSFDYDPDSVEATTSVWRNADSPKHWTVLQGDILDLPFVQSLGTFSIVYSW